MLLLVCCNAASLMALDITPGPQKYVCDWAWNLFPTKCGTGTYADSGLELGCATGQVLAEFDCLPNATVDALPVWATKHGAGAEQCQRIVHGTGVVECNVPEHVFLDLLSQVDIDAKEVGWEGGWTRSR